MKAVREIYDFITGGSIASPIGLALAIAITIFDAGLPVILRGAFFAGIIIASLAVTTFERVV